MKTELTSPFMIYLKIYIFRVWWGTDKGVGVKDLCEKIRRG